jgi:hypothetical protein
MNSYRRRRLALIEKAIPVSPPPAIFVCFTGCSPVRAEALDGGRVWNREPDEEIEDFEERVRADLPQCSAVPPVVIFHHET